MTIRNPFPYLYITFFPPNSRLFFSLILSRKSFDPSCKPSSCTTSKVFDSHPSATPSTTIVDRGFLHHVSPSVQMPSRAVLSGKIEKRRTMSSLPKRSALLNLPVDLICEITTHLSPADNIILATACRAVRNAAGRGQFPPADTEESLEQRFAYLAGMCRDMPGHWVCEECLRYHRIDTADTPGDSRPTCPRADPYGRYNQPLHLAPADEYELGRRHVQLALKYTRMGDALTPSLRRYLGRLTAARQFSLAYPWRKRVAVAAKVAPRVVDGRFLLRTICEYRRPSRPVTRDLIASESVCRHQQLFPLEDAAWTSSALHQDLRRFPCAVDEAFEAPGKEVRGHCPHCFTDFSVTATARSVRISVWMDLGTESSPLDPVWRSFVHNVEFPPVGEVEYVEPGRVRELYGSGEEEE